MGKRLVFDNRKTRKFEVKQLLAEVMADKEQDYLEQEAFYQKLCGDFVPCFYDSYEDEDPFGFFQEDYSYSAAYDDYDDYNDYDFF